MNSSSLKNKVRSNKGATIVFALVALILCVMISAVVIYTAFSNVGRVKKTQSEEQNYLSVSSAVMLFKDSLEGDSVSYEETHVSTTTIICDENWEPIDPTPGEPTLETKFDNYAYNDADALPLNNFLNQVFEEWAKKVDPPVSQPPLPITITDTSDPRDLPNIAPVEAEIVFDPENMKMTITFCIKDASPLDVDKYSTIMTMDLSKSTSYPVTFSTEQREKISNNYVKTITVTKKYFHTISWNNCMITKQKEANTGG
jgi:hypothetical protein